MSIYKQAKLADCDSSLRVWLSHDVDWVKKNIIQTCYYSLTEKRFYHLLNRFSNKNNYWNFEAYQNVESKYNAKSTFFFLNESIKPKINNLRSIKLGYGRYSIHSDKIQSKIREIDSDGWEVGLHGSYFSYNNFELLKEEKNVLENILGHEVYGTRQHHLNNEIPLTWKYQEELGFQYDSSIGKKYSMGFDESYSHPFNPFNNSFTVFPVILMDSFLMGLTKDIKKGEVIIANVIQEAIRRNAVLTVIWHNRSYNKNEFPQLYHWYNFLLNEVKNINGKFVMPMDEIV